jgi:hypothetical protein
MHPCSYRVHAWRARGMTGCGVMWCHDTTSCTCACYVSPDHADGQHIASVAVSRRITPNGQAITPYHATPYGQHIASVTPYHDTPHHAVRPRPREAACPTPYHAVRHVSRYAVSRRVQSASPLHLWPPACRGQRLLHTVCYRRRPLQTGHLTARLTTCGLLAAAAEFVGRPAP